MNTAQLCRYLESVLKDAKDPKGLSEEQKTAINNLNSVMKMSYGKLAPMLNADQLGQGKNLSLIIDGLQDKDGKTNSSFTLLDLLTKDIVLNQDHMQAAMPQTPGIFNNEDQFKQWFQESSGLSNDEIAGLDFKSLIKTFQAVGSGQYAGAKLIAASFADYLDKTFRALIPDELKTEMEKTLQYAKMQVAQVLMGQCSPDEKAKVGTLNCWSKDFKSISLSNVTEAYITYIAQAIGGYGESGYGVDKTVDKSNFATDDPSFLFTIDNIYNKDLYDSKTLLYADFYNAMYNNICKNGWTTVTEDVYDKQYLQNALKNGQLFIASLNDEGYFYQGEYTRNGHVVEVADEDAIARANSEYTKTKARLNYKEECIEIDMKNLDMEIASLSAEYDSVKNIISKNAEKVFSLFQ
jgi:hypothetical protein